MTEKVDMNPDGTDIVEIVHSFTLTNLRKAFDLAEQETADHFNGQTCSMKDKNGNSTCPICFFRIRVKYHLGLIE